MTAKLREYCKVTGQIIGRGPAEPTDFESKALHHNPLPPLSSTIKNLEFALTDSDMLGVLYNRLYMYLPYIHMCVAYREVTLTMLMLLLDLV